MDSFSSRNSMRGAGPIDPFDLAFPDMEVDIVRIINLLLFDVAKALKEPRFGMLDLRHGVQQLSAGGSTYVLDQRLVIERSLMIESKFAVDFRQEIDHLLCVNVEEVEKFVNRKP
jgi:hypothetical protein